MTHIQAMTYIQAAERLLNLEARALAGLAARLDSGFRHAVMAVLEAPGHVIVTGLGKSGLIGAKIAASLASTGTPAFFVHSADALHGDAGAVTERDVVIAISNSGTTAEVVAFAAMCRGRACTVVAMTGDSRSPLARGADATIDIAIDSEADPLGLAPTSSTTVTLAMGDALVAALMEARSFTPADFGVNHPGGALGAAVRGTR